MQQRQVAQVIAFLNSSWTNKPLDELASVVWGAELSRHPFDDVMRVLQVLLTTSEWRPSLAQILKPIIPASNVKSAHAAFETVYDKLCGRSVEPNDLEERAVKRLGGWSVLGHWQTTERHWHFKEFKLAYDELVEGEASAGLRALASGEQRALEGERPQ